jgi:hypothetical protein
MEFACGYSAAVTACEVKSDRILSITLIVLSILAVDLCGAAELERSVSPSGQFIIYGGDPAWRGAISKLAEQTKANLLAVLQRRDQWTIAAVINLQSRAANLPEIPNTRLRFSQTGGGLKLQLDLAISRDVNLTAVEREILRVILLEMIYHNQTAIASGEVYVEPPDWLVDGLLALTPSRDRAPIIDALKASERGPALRDFLCERPELLDPAGRSLYRAHSFALVQLLNENPARLGRYIDNLASSSNDPVADLQKSFPQLAGNDAENIWKSKIASVKDSSRTDLLTFLQTDERLNALLKTLALEELCQKKLTVRQKLELKKFGEALMLFSARANPALRPIVQDYQQLAGQLALGKNHDVAKKLGDLGNLRAKLSARMGEVDDYMNWFEATQLQTSSGLFENLNASADNAVPRPRRKDAFSKYLDAMEQQF